MNEYRCFWIALGCTLVMPLRHSYPVDLLRARIDATLSDTLTARETLTANDLPSCLTICLSWVPPWQDAWWITTTVTTAIPTTTTAATPATSTAVTYTTPGAATPTTTTDFFNYWPRPTIEDCVNTCTATTPRPLTTTTLSSYAGRWDSSFSELLTFFSQVNRGKDLKIYNFFR